jgi:CheY-like chemotaxis protein
MTKKILPFFENALIIDDEEIDNLINERLLQANYFAKNVEAKTNIPSALNTLYKAMETGEGVPDIIFLDLHMPEYNGFHFLLEFKQMLYKYEELRKTKVVVLSAFINKYPQHLLNTYDFVVGKINKPLASEALDELREKLEVVAVPA